MKPIIIIRSGAMTPDNIKLLNDNDLCVVECEDPAAVKFVDPIPAVSSRSQIEQAAINLSRRLLTNRNHDYDINGLIGSGKVAKLFVECLVMGTPLSAAPTEAELLEEERRIAKREEAAAIGREEARAEAARKKAEKDAAAEKKKTNKKETP